MAGLSAQLSTGNCLPHLLRVAYVQPGGFVQGVGEQQSAAVNRCRRAT
ncbi:MAG TPA: hypothetical protein VII97_12080 [Anaerolineales bacterium]